MFRKIIIRLETEKLKLKNDSKFLISDYRIQMIHIIKNSLPHHLI